MIAQTSTLGVLAILIFSVFFMFSPKLSADCEIKSDDGIPEDFFYLSNSIPAVKKIVILKDADLKNAAKTYIKYFMKRAPLVISSQKSPDMRVRVNGNTLFHIPVNNGAFSMGWHSLSLPSSLLKVGGNTLEFKLSDFSTISESQKKHTHCYFGFDTTTRSDLSFQQRKNNDKWIPCEGELMIRLLLKSDVASKTPSIPTLKSPIRIDGEISDSEWKNVLTLHNFFNLRSKEPAAATTTTYLKFDDHNLYLAIICDEPNMSGLVANSRRRDGKIWADDSVEFFIDSNATKESYYHFIINPNGVFYDSFCPIPFKHTPSWNSDAEIRASKQNDKWSIEAKIPFKDLFGATYQDFSGDRLIGFNIIRNRALTGAKSSWMRFSGTTIHAPKQFATFKMDRNSKGIRISFDDVKEKKCSNHDKMWKVDQPVFKKVFSEKPRCFKNVSAVITYHALLKRSNPKPANFALQTGTEYRRKTFFNIINKSDMLFLDQPGIGGTLAFGSMEAMEARKNKLRILYKDNILSLVRYSKNDGEYATTRSPVSLVTVNGLKFKEALRSSCAILSKNKDLIWGTSHDDESIDSDLDVFYKNVLKPDWTGRKRIDNAIKKNNGFGKYGLPNTGQDDNPFRWIATNRYFIDRMVEAYKTIYSAQKAINPQLRISSTTHRNGYKTFLNLSRLADYLDFTSIQITSDLIPNRQNVAFLSKYFKDLSPLTRLMNSSAKFFAAAEMDS